MKYILTANKSLLWTWCPRVKG